jgi:SAM-dependent methyltransferase
VNDYTLDQGFSGALAVLDGLGERARPAHVLEERNDAEPWPDDVVVDVGCGKGRVLNWLLAHRRGCRLYGIELDRDVCARTARRLRRWPNVTILCGDATELLPADATVFYLFNPFDRTVMQRFADAVLALPPRPRRIVYYRANDLDVFRDRPRFRVRELDDPRLNHPSAVVEVL